MEQHTDTPLTAAIDSDTESKNELAKGQKLIIDISDNKSQQYVEVEIVDIIDGFVPRVQFTYADWNGSATASLTRDEFMQRMGSSSRVAQALSEMDAADKDSEASTCSSTRSLFDKFKQRLKKTPPTYVPYPREDAGSEAENAEQEKQMDIFVTNLYDALKQLAADEPALVQRWASMDYMPGLLDQVLQTLKNKYNIIINPPSPQLHDELDKGVKFIIQELAADRIK